jgi:hypothetical protein
VAQLEIFAGQRDLSWTNWNPESQFLHNTEDVVNDSYSAQFVIFSTQFKESEVGIFVPEHVLQVRLESATVEALYSTQKSISERHFNLSPV